jgi:hypothetical protein
MMTSGPCRHCQGCPIGGAGQIGGYVVFGSSMDYLYDKLGVKCAGQAVFCVLIASVGVRGHVRYSLTFEVHGGQGPLEDCFRCAHEHECRSGRKLLCACFDRYFNPTTREEYETSTYNWAMSFLTAADYLLRVGNVVGICTSLV